MEYIHESFDRYVKYLDENKDRFPSHIYDFASDENRHNLDSVHSLHDSWLTSITIKENRKKDHPFDPKPSIEIVFLGPMHDRDIILKYEDIESYELLGNKNPYNWADTYQGDVSCHEVRVNDEGFLIHEIEFVSDSKIYIVCKNFDCVEDVYT